MSTPRTKRQFAGAAADPAQRQITSFFSSHPANETPSEAQKPVLPASVESNLLIVGMRVRKSVPEGYKTAGPSAFKLWTDNSPLPPPPPSTPRKGLNASSRELLPFCGINKVGGLSAQPEFEGDGEEDYVPELDALPELTMSQESAGSVDSPHEPSRKRIFNEDEGDEDYEIMTQSDCSNARVLAVPVSRTKKTVFRGIGQENMAVDNDFEEAEFLVYGGNRGHGHG